MITDMNPGEALKSEAFILVATYCHILTLFWDMKIEMATGERLDTYLHLSDC